MKIGLKIKLQEFTKNSFKRMDSMKMSDILCQQKISSKFSKFDEYENKKIIEKIYKEKKEIKVIKILELTFEELFIIFRRKLNDKEDICNKQNKQNKKD